MKDEDRLSGIGGAVSFFAIASPMDRISSRIIKFIFLKNANDFLKTHYFRRGKR